MGRDAVVRQTDALVLLENTVGWSPVLKQRGFKLITGTSSVSCTQQVFYKCMLSIMQLMDV